MSMVNVWQAIPANDHVCELGETPRLDARTGELLWTDITAGQLHFGRLAGHRIELLRTLIFPGKSGPVTPLKQAHAGWIMAHESGLSHVSETGELTELAQLESGLPTAFNDGAADPEGNLWAGSMSVEGAQAAGSLWRIGTDGTAGVVLEDIGISNGIDFTTDGLTAYYVDTSSKRLDVLTISADGSVLSRHGLVEFSAEDGAPDGIAVDQEGFIWVAMWDGWAVRRYSPQGELVGIVELPVSRPTAVCFVGDTLVVTTCSGWLAEGWNSREPDAGKLFTAHVGIQGLPARPYTGQLKISHAASKA